MKHYHGLLCHIMVFALTSCVAVMSVSCGSTRPGLTAHRSQSGRKPDKAKPARPTPGIKFKIPAGADAVTERLLSEAKSWLGTPYQWGGNTRDGVDCSGFVLQVYQRSLGISLPRNSAKQREYCSPIDFGMLAVGDLIFFTGSKSSDVGHVGIYIGDGKMIHSSTSKGVIVSPLSQQYYVDHLHSYGRIERYHAMLSKPGRPIGAKQPVITKSPGPAPMASVGTVSRKPVLTPVRIQPGTATAAAMEENRQRALQALISQIEDSITASAQ